MGIGLERVLSTLGGARWTRGGRQRGEVLRGEGEGERIKRIERGAPPWRRAREREGEDEVKG